MIIYLDVIFLENLMMNCIILYATNYILKKKVNIIKIACAGMIGALYSVIVYLDILKIYSNIITKIILSIIMVYIGCDSKKIYKELLTFYLISFVFGGAAFSVIYMIKPQNIIKMNGEFIGRYPIKFAIAGGILGFGIISLVFKFAKRKISKKDMIYNLEIYFNKKKIGIKAMLDTGNFLKEPITGAPVIVAEKRALLNLIDKNILENAEKIIGGDFELIKEKKNFLSNFKIIPYSSIGRQNGMLLGFKTEKVLIKDEEETKEIKDVIVAIYNKSFSKNQSYSALIGLELIERSERNEYITNF